MKLLKVEASANLEIDYNILPDLVLRLHSGALNIQKNIFDAP
jgi:hypothetical protein